MSEKSLIGTADAKYTGILDMEGLKACLVKWGKDNDYKIMAAKSEEKAYPEGKEILYEGTFERIVADWMKINLKLKLDFREMTQIEVEIHDKKKMYWKGNCKAGIKAFMISDTEKKWQKDPSMHVFRAIADKFLTKSDVGKAQQRCKDDMKSMINEIKAYLNLDRWPEP
jgi:hypothetical protein